VFNFFEQNVKKTTRQKVKHRSIRSLKKRFLQVEPLARDSDPELIFDYFVKAAKKHGVTVSDGYLYGVVYKKWKPIK